MMVFAFELLVSITALSVLPVAWSVHRQGLQNYKNLMKGSFITGCIVFVAFLVLIIAPIYPSLSSEIIKIRQEKKEMTEAKTRLTLMEPHYLPIEVKNKRREELINNGIVWNYTCNSKPNTFKITQVSLNNMDGRPNLGFKTKEVK